MTGWLICSWGWAGTTLEVCSQALACVIPIGVLCILQLDGMRSGGVCDVGGVVCHGVAYRLVTALAFGLAIAMFLYSAARCFALSGDYGALAALGICGIFALVGWAVFREARKRFLVSNDGVGVMVGGRVCKRIKWAEVVSVRMSGCRTRVIIKDANGLEVGLSDGMRGLDCLMLAIRDHVDVNVVASAVRNHRAWPCVGRGK